MKKLTVMLLIACLLMTGCMASDPSRQPQTTAPTQAQQVPAETAQPQAETVTILPLADSTMEGLTDCIVAISLEPGDVYRDEAGKAWMVPMIYGYDMYDMVDIAQMKAGDTIVLCGEEILAAELTRLDNGTLQINGGLDAGGIDLVTDDTGVFFAQGYSDVKSWNLLGQAQLEISERFVFTDSSDLDKGSITDTVDLLLSDSQDLIFHFRPENTTVRIENGQVVEMTRVYTP